MDTATDRFQGRKGEPTEESSGKGPEENPAKALGKGKKPWTGMIPMGAPRAKNMPKI